MTKGRIKQETLSCIANDSISEDVKLKEIRIHPDTTKANLKEVKDKIVKLICEVGKLQEQVSAIASQGDGKCGSEETTSNMKKGRLNEMITVAIL